MKNVFLLGAGASKSYDLSPTGQSMPIANDFFSTYSKLPINFNPWALKTNLLSYLNLRDGLDHLDIFDFNEDIELAEQWALKAALNLTMPANGEFEMPTGGSITLERQLNDWLSLESGIKYTYMHSGAQTLHYLSIPIKANATLAKLSKVDIYATAGGSADKCVSATHSSANENIQFTAMAGIGVRYHLSNKIAVFAEPTITHYFNNESKYTSYRAEKNNAFSLQSGLCMNF